MSDPLHEDRRCRRGERCAHRERIVDTVEADVSGCPCACHGGGLDAACDQVGGCGHLHPTVETTTFLGKLLENPADGYCPICAGKLGLVLHELPALIVRLNLAHLPTLAIRYRTDDINGGGELHPPIPLNELADAMIRLVDHETRVAAKMVADAAGVPWSSHTAASQPVGERIQTSCQLLEYRLMQWLHLGPREYRARSLTEHPQEGHGAAPVEAKAGDWWVTRDGPDQATRLIGLHRLAGRVTGMTGNDWVPSPCGYCSNRTLYRQHDMCIVVCRTCGDAKSDDAHDEFVAAALAAHGVSA